MFFAALALCAAFVFMVKFIDGKSTLKNRKEENANDEKKEAPEEEPAPQQIYYIVERKKRAPKKDYGEPKQISFK